MKKTRGSFFLVNQAETRQLFLDGDGFNFSYDWGPEHWLILLALAVLGLLLLCCCIFSLCNKPKPRPPMPVQTIPAPPPMQEIIV